MSEWAVVTVIVTLAGFIIAIITPIIKVNTTITRMSSTVSTLEKDIQNISQHSRQRHLKIMESEKELSSQIAELRIKLAVMESAGK